MFNFIKEKRYTALKIRKAMENSHIKSVWFIGNGFDLAHGLETSYKHFIDWFWRETLIRIKNRGGFSYKDDYISVPNRFLTYDVKNGNVNFQDYLSNLHSGKITYKNRFLEIITQKTYLQNWVDIEEEYYQQIKDIVQGKSQCYKDDIRRNLTAKTAVAKLNEDFEKIKQELERFLLKDTDKTSKIEDIHNLFYDSLKLRDIASSKESLLMEYISEMLYSSSPTYRADEYYNNFRDNLFKEIAEKYKIQDRDVEIEHITNYLKNNKPNYFNDDLYKIFPRRTLILNFNYTETESLYSNYETYKGDRPSCDLPLFFHVQTIHIHGELNKIDNPIIFGYGDELADEYKLSDKEYFKNLKTIKYLKTDNYKRLTSFADSDFFQIYIFGHSCGNSDRTLLNTLFEHENCISIKPFFHEKKENGKVTNDYEDTAINISRNFNIKNKAVFREKVVNETYCKPLPQKEK